MRPSLATEVTVTSDDGTSFRYEFTLERVSIGRSALAEIRLPDPAVSTLHAVVERMGDALFLSDLGSTNGTRLAGARIPRDRRTPLRDADEFLVGRFRLRARALSAATEVTSRAVVLERARQLVKSSLARARRDQEASLLVLNGPQEGKRFVLAGERVEWTIGRDEACDVVVSDAKSSRTHARVVAREASFFVVDAGAKNGVLLNGAPLDGEQRLCDRDEITIGRTRFVFDDPTDCVLHNLDAPDMSHMEESGYPKGASRLTARRGVAAVAALAGRERAIVFLAAGALVAAAVVIAILVFQNG